MIKDERYKLYQGECLEVMDELIGLGVKFDAIITDPPFGTTTCKWDSVIPFDKMWERVNKLTKNTSPIVLFGSQPFTSVLISSNIKCFREEVIWLKNKSGSGLQAKQKHIMFTTKTMQPLATKQTTGLLHWVNKEDNESWQWNLVS